ncbi:MAG: DNA-binding protein, partial [Pigmentiphaga sp.]
MARGITESDVHTAADELVANGDRPTVERIRAHLGTGSPNTVTRWLDTWWKNLGIRLQPKRPDLKDAPAVLAELAGQWWALALQHARESALEELANARQSLAVEYEELRMQQQNFADEGSALHAKATASAQSERLALTQVAELRQLIDQLQAQLAESARQHASTDQRLEQAESARRVVEARSQELQELARSERESLMEHAN